MEDPLGDNEMQRVCHGCVNSNKRTEPSEGSADGQGKGKDKQAGAMGSLSAGTAASKYKARGAAKRARPDFHQ